VPARGATSHDLIATPVLRGLHHRYAFLSAGPSPGRPKCQSLKNRLAHRLRGWATSSSIAKS
jgi:hypothetical protein